MRLSRLWFDGRADCSSWWGLSVTWRGRAHSHRLGSRYCLISDCHTNQHQIQPVHSINNRQSSEVSLQISSVKATMMDTLNSGSVQTSRSLNARPMTHNTKFYCCYTTTQLLMLSVFYKRPLEVSFTRSLVWPSQGSYPQPTNRRLMLYL